MKVDIWSDVRCPFCYIGKHRFEAALEKFPKKEEIEVTWHSFQLDPNLQTQPDLNTIEYFVEAKGVSEEQAEQMLAGAKQMAEETGLDMDLKNSMVANSFKAHQLIHLAKSKGLANDIKEALFIAHFKDLKNIDDEDVLVGIGASVGVNETAIKEALSSGKFASHVKQDEMQAQKIGVRGVPFFVFNNQYGVSGAQPTETFLDVLEKVYEESGQSK